MKGDKIILESKRLKLREFAADDFELLYDLNRREDVTRYVGGPMTRDQAQALLTGRILDYYRQFPGLGVWATLLKSDGAFIGFHLLNHIRDTDIIQVGYRLLPQHWGKGYATEMSRELLRYGFEQHGLREIAGITHPENLDSQHVLKKLGMRWIRKAYYFDSDVEFFALTRELWAASTTPAAAAP